MHVRSVFVLIGGFNAISLRCPLTVHLRPPAIACNKGVGHVHSSRPWRATKAPVKIEITKRERSRRVREVRKRFSLFFRWEKQKKEEKQKAWRLVESRERERNSFDCASSTKAKKKERERDGKRAMAVGGRGKANSARARREVVESRIFESILFEKRQFHWWAERSGSNNNNNPPLSDTFANHSYRFSWQNLISFHRPLSLSLFFIFSSLHYSYSHDLTAFYRKFVAWYE